MQETAALLQLAQAFQEMSVDCHVWSKGSIFISFVDYDSKRYIKVQEIIIRNFMKTQNVAYAFENFCPRHLPWSRHMPAFETQAFNYYAEYCH